MHDLYRKVGIDKKGFFLKGLLHRAVISTNQSEINLHPGGWGQRQEARKRILV